MTKRDLEKEQIWKKKLGDYKNSGLSQIAWCKKNGEKLSRLKYWQKKLANPPTYHIQFEELKDTSFSFVEIRKKEISIRVPSCNAKTLQECL